MSADGKRFHSSTLKSSTLIASEIIQKPRRIASMNVTQATRVRVSSFFLFLFLSLSLSLSLSLLRSYCFFKKHFLIKDEKFKSSPFVFAFLKSFD